MKRLLLLAVLLLTLVGCGTTTFIPPAPTATATALSPSLGGPTPTDTPFTQLPAPAKPATQAPTPTPTPSPTPSPSGPQFVVLSVDLAVSPSTRSNTVCGTPTTFTYTATFHVAGGSPGGLVQFNYTTTNGRQISMGTLNFLSGATVEAFTFTATGMVTADNTFPGTAGVFVTLPNEVRSPVVQITGSCVTS